MANDSITTANAQVNAWSNAFFNLGTALFGAVGYRLFVETNVDVTVGLWIAVAMLFIAIGHKMLVLIEEEVR